MVLIEVQMARIICLLRSHPPTPEEYAADVRAELNTLKDAILMPRRRSAKLSTQLNRVK